VITQKPSLRERQAEELRASLRAAFVELVLDRGGLGFSLHDVAATAGVSDRTLYRHYPSREALVEAVATESAAELERDRRDDVNDPRSSLFGDTEWVADAFERFEEHGDLMRALRMLRASGAENPASDERTRLARELLREAGIDPRAVEQLTALLRLMTGGDAWARMAEPDLALDAREAGYAAHWAAQVLIRAAQQTAGPLRPVVEDSDDADG
jgi:AcrR family transcriptional regulator